MTPRAGTTFLVVGPGEDPLCVATHACAARRGLHTRLLERSRLGEASVILDETKVWVDGEPVGALLFRGRAHGASGGGFRREDQPFVDVEVAAVWLAAMHLPTVRCVNRYAPPAWYDLSPWATVGRALRRAQVPVAPMTIGRATTSAGRNWLPYTESSLQPPPDARTRRVLAAAAVDADGVQQALAVAGEPLGEATADMRRIARVLEENGIQLAHVLATGSGEVIAVDTTPVVTDRHLAEAAAERLVRWIVS